MDTKTQAKVLYDAVELQIRSEIDSSKRITALEQRIAALEAQLRLMEQNNLARVRQ